MAISKTKIPIANVSDITAAIKAALESTGMYDSVTVSSNTVTAADNGKTYFTVAVASTTVFTVYSDNITGAAFTLLPESTVAVGIGTTGGSVMISAFGGDTITVVLTKSKGGQRMIFARWVGYVYHAVSADSRADSVITFVPVANDMYSSLADICASSASETVAVPDGASVFAVKEAQIPATTDANKRLYQVTIGAKSYLTDGAFCLAES